ncbi:MAG: hypothetical protein AB7S72_16245 [Draconibacterium sp.]
MKSNSIKLVGKKLYEVSLEQNEEFKWYSIIDESGGQIDLCFNKNIGSFNGHHSQNSESFSGSFINNILNFHSQDGKTSVFVISEYLS